MNEKLLQFIWQFQYFNTHALFTTEGETMKIEKPGKPNQHQGPDFMEAMIVIGGTRWAGNVELHVLASDWYRHGHRSDIRYANIILHVVWEEDRKVYDAMSHLFPTLVLQPLVSKLMLDRYRMLMENLQGIPCRRFLPALEPIAWMAWKERLAAERLERKSKEIIQRLNYCKGNWEECCWQLLAHNFGIRINAQLFEQVAVHLPYSLLARHRSNLLQVEALLFGQANLLTTKFNEAYPLSLQKEYRYLKKKYQLVTIPKQPAFLRMRPVTFPTIRLAQLAMLVYRQPVLFSLIRDAPDLGELQKIYMVTAGHYWDTHYRFEETAQEQPKHLGKQMADILMINTVTPLLFAYGIYTGDNTCREKAVSWLLQLPKETNRITSEWAALGIASQHALDSQALIELTNHYCLNRLCLSCAAGNRILGNYV